MGCSSTKEAVQESAEVELTLNAENCRLLIITWNVGNAPPPDDLSLLFPNKYDLIVIGTQECQFGSAKDTLNTHKIWLDILRKNLKSYELLCDTSLMEMRIAAFCTKEFKKHVSNIHTETEATGIANVVGNKGGTVLSFHIKDTRVCFVNSHLAAHQEFINRRNENVSEIIKNVHAYGAHLTDKSSPISRFDLLHQFHHVFWMGDLNYRLDYGNQGKDKSPSEELFNEMTDLIKKKDYDTLFACDQLTREMKEGNVFIGFNEGQYNFPPTFKVERNEQLKYKKQRSPAWCDRVLWKSCPECKVAQRELGTCLDIMTSDHKPVYSVFDLEYWRFPAGHTSVVGDCTLILTDVKAFDLPAADIGGKSDPYFVLYADFISNGKSNEYKSEFISSTLNPEWKEDVQLKLNINTKNKLRMSSILVAVYDHDVASRSDLLGLGKIDFQPFIGDGDAWWGEMEYGDIGGPISIPLTRGGLPVGKFEAHLKLDFAKFI